MGTVAPFQAKPIDLNRTGPHLVSNFQPSPHKVRVNLIACRHLPTDGVVETHLDPSVGWNVYCLQDRLWRRGPSSPGPRAVRRTPAEVCLYSGGCPSLETGLPGVAGSSPGQVWWRFDVRVADGEQREKLNLATPDLCLHRASRRIPEAPAGDAGDRAAPTP